MRHAYWFKLRSVDMFDLCMAYCRRLFAVFLFWFSGFGFCYRMGTGAPLLLLCGVDPLTYI